MSDGPTLSEQVKALRNELRAAQAEAMIATQSNDAMHDRLARAEALLWELEPECTPPTRSCIRAFLESK